jgi:GTPase SAR1 family protein
MIIVEGPDGAGKTTLIQQIMHRYPDIKVAPRAVSKEAIAMVNMGDWVDTNLEEGLQYRLFDRHRLISEPIYGPVLRSHQDPRFVDLKWLGPRMKRFYELKPTIIYCLPSLEEVHNNLQGDADNVVVKGRINNLYASYVERISLDETFSPGITKVWNYLDSLTIDGAPAWLPSVMQNMKERTTT